MTSSPWWCCASPSASAWCRRKAFAGFGYPAVITVAAALVIRRAVSMTGLLDAVAQQVAGKVRSPTLSSNKV